MPTLDQWPGGIWAPPPDDRPAPPVIPPAPVAEPSQPEPQAEPTPRKPEIGAALNALKRRSHREPGEAPRTWELRQ